MAVCRSVVIEKKQTCIFVLLFIYLGMIVSGITSINLPALEKRFQLSSKDLGLIAASNDISAILLVSFVSFFGEFGNKIKWLGYGMLITGQCQWRMRYLRTATSHLHYPFFFLFLEMRRHERNFVALRPRSTNDKTAPAAMQPRLKTIKKTIQNYLQLTVWGLRS